MFQCKNKILIILSSVILISIICAIVVYSLNRYTPYVPEGEAQIYLYGEVHGKQELLEKEFEIWKEYYEKDNMRYLFVELPYYTAEYLNLWMQADDNQILDELYDDWEGTDDHVPEVKEFYEKIKVNCPETIFCGTDVGHQYATTGQRYIEYLKENGKENSYEYAQAVENINQGKKYYEGMDNVYRENAMTENFINAYNKIACTAVMGIYGDAHSDPRKKNYTNEVDCMAKQLKAHYGDIIEYNYVAKLIGEK